MQPSVFTKLFDDRSLEAAIETAAEIGYEAVEIMAREPHFPAETSRERAAEIRDLVDDLGVEISCLATYTGGYARADDDEREAELEAFERFLELSEPLEVDLVRHGAGRPSVRDATDDDFAVAAEWLRRAADLAADYDRTLALEIHSHRLTETVDATCDLVERIDRDNVGAIHDAGNLFIAADDYGPASLERLGDRLVHVHAKDLARVDDLSKSDTFELETGRGVEGFRRRFFGAGDLELEPLFRALADRGYDGYVTAESNVRSVAPETVARREHERITDLLERTR